MAEAVIVATARTPIGKAKRCGLQPLGLYHGPAVAGCNPDEMGIGPVFAIPKLLKKLRRGPLS